ncbi:hypothetical protein ACQ9BO_02370 [Flavobacterium sp. P21]|uniref:hypothetical protein n=1 Tax=Flavobacterium sp. P21 TaxID=3423948 RepID=UPI003D67E871
MLYVFEPFKSVGIANLIVCCCSVGLSIGVPIFVVAVGVVKLPNSSESCISKVVPAGKST